MKGGEHKETRPPVKMDRVTLKVRAADSNPNNIWSYHTKTSLSVCQILLKQSVCITILLCELLWDFRLFNKTVWEPDRERRETERGREAWGVRKRESRLCLCSSPLYLQTSQQDTANKCMCICVIERYHQQGFRPILSHHRMTVVKPDGNSLRHTHTHHMCWYQSKGCKDTNNSCIKGSSTGQ